MSNPDILKLNFDDKDLSHSNGIRWYSGQSGYEVEVQFPSGQEARYTYDYVFFVVNDAKNEKTLETSVMQRNGDNIYKALVKAPGFLKTDTKISVGVVGIKTEISGEDVAIEKVNITFKSNPALVVIQNSISTELTPEQCGSISALESLLSIIKGGKAIESFSIENKNLYVKYKGENAKTNLGQIGLDFTDKEDGILIERNEEENKGGGGKVGISATLSGNQTGFAGGYDSESEKGGAIGYKAVSTNGFAGGELSTAQHDGTIAIGPNANAGNEETKDDDEKRAIDAIAIGNSSQSKAKNSISIGASSQSTEENSIAIGKTAQALNKNSIVIGSDSKDKGEGSIMIGYNSNSGQSSNSSICIGESASANSAEKGLAIGTEAGINSGSGAIAIGNQAKIIGNNNIAIGISAKAGIKDDGNSSGSVNGVAIGNSAKSSGNGAIGIGINAKAEGYVGIAIGHNSLASANGSIAIGGQNIQEEQAIASAANAIQLGKGKNTTENSLKFQGVTIVKNGAVCANLEKPEVTGKLPVTKGGTGANNTSEGRHNLGIQSGTFNVVITDGSVYEDDKSFFTPYNNIPHVFLTMIDKDTSFPYRFTAMLDSVSKDKFRYKVQMGPDKNGKDFNKSNTITINWLAIGNYS